MTSLHVICGLGPRPSQSKIMASLWCWKIVELKLEDGQSSFRLGRGIMDQIFILKQIFEKSWKYGKDKSF